MEISFLNDMDSNNIDRIQFKIENNSENNADVWFSGIKEKLKLYDKDIKFGDSNNHLVLDFFLKEVSGTFIFDFYELKRLDLLLKFYFKKFFGKLKYRIDFSLGFGINEFRITASKEINFNNLVSIEFSYSDYSKFKYVPIYFDVDDNFFTGLDLESKKIVFSTAVAVGFKNPILPNKLPVIFKIRFQITYYKDFDSFYNFFKNSVTNFEDEKNFNIEFFGLGKIFVSTCEQYKKMVELFSPEFVDFKEDVKCGKLEIKNFGKKLFKKNGDNSFSIKFDSREFEIFDEIIFDTNAVPFSSLTFENDVFNGDGKKNITFKNLKDINNIGIKNPHFFEINIENCKLGYLEIWFDDYLKENFELKIKNTNFYGNFVVPSFAIDKIKGENNNAELVFIKMNVNSLVEINGIEKYIFGKTGIYIDYLEKFNDKVIATLFFIFNPIENKKSLYEKLKDIVEKQMGFDSGFRISVSGFDNDEDEYKFSNLYSILDELIVINGKKELKNVFNFLNIKNFLNG